MKNRELNIQDGSIHCQSKFCYPLKKRVLNFMPMCAFYSCVWSEKISSSSWVKGLRVIYSNNLYNLFRFIHFSLAGPQSRLSLFFRQIKRKFHHNQFYILDRCSALYHPANLIQYQSQPMDYLWIEVFFFYLDTKLIWSDTILFLFFPFYSFIFISLFNDFTNNVICC